MDDDGRATQSPFRRAMQPPRRNRSGSAGDTAEQLSQTGELWSTIGSILLSWIDFGLHLAVCIWTQLEFFGEHHMFWLFLIMAMVANLFGLVAYVARNAGEEPPDVGPPQPSELQQRFKERPEECMFVLLFGLVSTETLCFLSSDEREHLRFRKLGLLTNLIEGAPTLVLQVMFLYKYGWYSLITASFVFTICTLTVKLMRGWIIFCTETVDKDERIPLFKNLRWEDVVSLPVFLFHFVLVLVLLVWLDFAAYQDTFRVQWLQLQLEAIGGLEATLVFDNSTGAGLPSSLPNATGAGDAPLDLTTLTRDLLIHSDPNYLGWSSALSSIMGSGQGVAVYDTDSYEISEGAQMQVNEWVSLSLIFHTSFCACLFFFVAGLLSNVTCLTLYLRKPAYSEAFRSQTLWRRSITSSLIGVAGTINGGFFNALSQSEEGYRIVKRDSSLVSLLTHGIPILGIAAAAAASLDCQHRPCGVVLRGADAAAYVYMVIGVTCPVVWWLFARFVMQVIALRAPIDEDDEENQNAEDDGEPVVVGRESGNTAGMASQIFSLLFCFAKWMVQLLAVLQFYWNSSLYTGKGYMCETLGFCITPPSEFVLPFAVEEETFRTAIGIFAMGMCLNVTSIAWMLARWSTAALNRALQKRAASAVLGLSLSLVHPEMLALVADRRVDVFALRKLGAMTACCMDIPLLIVFSANMDWSWRNHGGYRDPFQALAIVVTAIHAAIYLARGIVVMVCGSLRKKSERRIHLPDLRDVLTIIVSFIQLILFAALIAVYEEGGRHSRGLVEEERATLFNATCAASAFLAIYVLANVGASVSFLNHYRFSHSNLTDYSFSSAFVCVAAAIDGQMLSMLSQDDVATREVKRAALMVSLATLLAPTLILQVAMQFVIRPDFALLEERSSLPVDSIIVGCMGLTIVTCVAKLLLLVILHTTRDRALGTPFYHTAFIGGPQWKENRKPQEGDEVEDDGAGRRPRRKPYAARNNSQTRGGFRGGAGAMYGDNADDEYADEYGNDGTGTMQSTEDAEGFELGEMEMMEATCLARALFTTPEGFRGVFIQLPVAEDQPMPFLFVQAHEERHVQTGGRFGGSRNRQVTFSFSSVDVGGLDREFVEQNICNNPEGAWRTFQDFQEQAAGLAVDEPAQMLSPGYVDAAALPAPYEDEPMTPRTAAAQRL